MPIFKDAFAAIEAELADRLIAKTTRTCELLLEKYGPSLNPRSNGFSHDATLAAHRTFFTRINQNDYSINADKTIDHDRIKTLCTDSAANLIDGFVAKLNAKLGDLDDAVVRRASAGGEFSITGTRNGKSVHVEQQTVIKVSSRGVWFAQFPARIYVDGKFTPASKYQAAIS